MQALYSFKLSEASQDYIYHVVDIGNDMVEVHWFVKGERHSFTEKKVNAQDMVDRGKWIIVGKEKVGEMNAEVKNMYRVALHHFLRLVQEDEFFIGDDVNLDLLTVLLGEDKGFEKKMKRLIEEHLRDEGSYRALL